jgi:hypothetical protein
MKRTRLIVYTIVGLALLAAVITMMVLLHTGTSLNPHG